MEGFLNWFFDFITAMIDGIWLIISGIGKGFVAIFDVPNYISIFKQYSSSFSLIEWVLAILAIIVIFGIWVLIFYMIILVIRKYVRFRSSIVSQEDILEELADLHTQVLNLTDEKQRIIEMKAVQSGTPLAVVRDVLSTGTTEAGTPVAATIAVQDAAYNAAVGISDSGGVSSPKKTGGDIPMPAGGATRFFKLVEVDEKYEYYVPPTYDTTLDLEQLCNTIRNFACSKMSLYYDVKIIRLMIAGFASTKLILLQGISGTGKTSLPYCLGKFFKNDATIASVQPSWRGRTELFGYFNEFTKRFNETEVLKRIYETSYNDDINLIVLDEMNIARVEYYFAEMLSILEMPDKSEWKLDLVPNAWETDPKHLASGKLQIPENLWYVGTANNDDSTFSVSDKVYDRALTINLDSKGIEFDAPPTEAVSINFKYLNQLFAEAIEHHKVTSETLSNISKLDIYIIQHFRVAFGNRIVKQLKEFIPVYVACGGNEIEGLDYILATKIFRKFESLNLSLIRDEIDGLVQYLDKMFGKGRMGECIAYLRRLQKMY